MDEANVYLKYRRNNNDDNEETEINMVDNDNVDMDELDEIFKSVRIGGQDEEYSRY